MRTKAKICSMCEQVLDDQECLECGTYFSELEDGEELACVSDGHYCQSCIPHCARLTEREGYEIEKQEAKE